VLGISFAALNAQSVQLNLYIKQISMPISILVIVMLAIGFLVGFLFTLCRQWRQNREIRDLKSKLSIAEKEVKNLRSIPISNDH
jgi:putative membrane protein